MLPLVIFLDIFVSTNGKNYYICSAMQRNFVLRLTLF